MDDTTKTLVDRLQEYADEDADLGYKTNRAQAFLEARAAIERQAKELERIKAELSCVEDGLSACHEVATGHEKQLEAARASIEAIDVKLALEVYRKQSAENRRWWQTSDPGLEAGFVVGFRYALAVVKERLGIDTAIAQAKEVGS